MPACVEPLAYANEHDIIAVLEKRILAFEDQIEEYEDAKRSIENSIRWEVELLAEVKENKLTNETKRQMKFNQFVEENEKLPMINDQLKNHRREVKKLRIELGNEQRAYSLQLAAMRAKGGVF